ncbi:MAG: GntR family transcriptional regulator [Anaerolineales bacterium]|nr:GntR family transcriptional regulator [Anaerolineales bacterium]
MVDEIVPITEGEWIVKRSLKDSVFNLLHERIVAGEYLPGEWLRQEDLALQLKVSQTPVREALDLLVSVGLAVRVPYRGVRVPEWSAEEMVDAYVLRLILESAAARMASCNMTVEQLETLEKIVEQTRGLITLDAMSLQRQLNKRFHLLIAEASANSQLFKLYQMVSNQFPDWRLYEYMFRHPELLEENLRREYGEHRAIYEALAAGEPDEAAAQVLLHIRNLSRELVEYLGVPQSLIQEKEQQVEQMLST